MIFSMTEKIWRPLSVNNEESIAKYDALHDGVPQWIEKRFWDWVIFSFYAGPPEGEEVFLHEEIDIHLVIELGMVLQIPLPSLPSGRGPHLDRVELRSALENSSRGLDIADYLLSHGGHSDSDILDWLLGGGKSAWMVGERLGRPGLVRRVAEGVQDAADEVMESSGTAGIKLAQAWEALYGLHPNPTTAYSLAIKAVEDAAIPAVSPKHSQATLGTVIATIRDQKDWNLPMAREDNRAPSGQVLLEMMQMLWTGQHDRHGGNTDIPALTQGEAVVAVSLAVTLVHWFTTHGLVQRSRNRTE